MRKNLLKLLSLILVVFTVLALAVACAPAVENEENQSVSGTAGEEDPVERLDWSGRPFKILATHNEHEPNFEIIGVAGEDRLSAKVYERNVLVKEYCNVEIQDVAGDESSLVSLEKDYMSGTQSYDLAFLVRDDMSTAIQKGYMKDITQVNYINLENPWYNSLTIDSLKLNGRLYHMTSDFSLVDKARTNTLFFNRDMADELNLEEDVIEMIREGTWTIETMRKMVKAAALDDGDALPEKTDTYGVVCGGSEGALAFYSGMGNTLVSFDSNNNYQIKLIEDRSLNCLEYIKEILDVYQWNGFTGSEYEAWDKDYDAPYAAFVDGRALFLSSSMGTIESLSAEADFAYTAITYPKYNEDQEVYYTTNDNTYGSTFGIPYMAGDLDFCGYMIEVLSWKSHTTTYPEYYEVKCLVQKSYDPICAEMMRLNYEGMVYDFGLQFSNSVKYKRAVEKFVVYNKENKAMTTFFEEYENAANSAIQGILATVEELPK